jgi:hypothetical protein
MLLLRSCSEDLAVGAGRCPGSIGTVAVECLKLETIRIKFIYTSISPS